MRQNIKFLVDDYAFFKWRWVEKKGKQTLEEYMQDEYNSIPCECPVSNLPGREKGKYGIKGILYYFFQNQWWKSERGYSTKYDFQGFQYETCYSEKQKKVLSQFVRMGFRNLLSEHGKKYYDDMVEQEQMKLVMVNVRLNGLRSRKRFKKFKEERGLMG